MIEIILGIWAVIATFCLAAIVMDLRNEKADNALLRRQNAVLLDEAGEQRQKLSATHSAMWEVRGIIDCDLGLAEVVKEAGQLKGLQ